MSKTYRDARNAACAVQSAADRIVHLLTEAALDQAGSMEVGREKLFLAFDAQRRELACRLVDLHEIIGEQPE